MSENNTELLRLLDLPVFKNSEELASLLHLKHKAINALVMRNSRFYKKYSKPKKSGGTRLICQPNRDQKAIQAWILRNILEKLSISNHATAFIKNRGMIQNVLPHSSNRYFLNVDLENFFDTIKFAQVFRVFHTIGYSPKASWMLARLCTCNDTLPQGGISSPYLSNIILFKMDRRISSYLSRRNVIYTRYSDDLTLSAQNPKVLKRIYPAIQKIIESSQFTVNQNKVRFSRPACKTRITGLIKNSANPKFSIGRHKKRILRSMIFRHFTLFTFRSRRIDNKILGWLNYLKSVDMDNYNYLLAYYKKLEILYPKQIV